MAYDTCLNGPNIGINGTEPFLFHPQMRIESRRDGLAPCIVHRDFEPAAWTQKEWGKIIVTKVTRKRGCVTAPT